MTENMLDRNILIGNVLIWIDKSDLVHYILWYFILLWRAPYDVVMKTCLVIGDRTRTCLYKDCAPTGVPGVFLYGDSWTIWDIEVNSITRMHGRVDKIVIYFDPSSYHEYSIMDYIGYSMTECEKGGSGKVICLMPAVNNDAIRKCKISGIRYAVSSDLSLINK